MEPIIIISSRQKSSRLPGKAFIRVAGIPALEHIINRVLPLKIKTVVAVPFAEKHDYQVKLKKYKSLEIFAGNPESPLHRMEEFLSLNPKYTHVVRITHDDLIIDGKTILSLLEEIEKTGAGYGYTPQIVGGAGVEVICRENIMYAAGHNAATEFISYFVKGNNCPNPAIHRGSCRDSINRPFRLTMDYEADWQLLNTVLRHTGPSASTDKICRYLDEHPELLNLNTQPVLTFYTCAYNAGKTIAQTINSVLSTGFEFSEYIIVDDASTDNTISEISKFSRDRRIRLIINGDNRGLSSSSNIAVAAARGKYIMRVDADDMLIPGEFKQAFYNMAETLDHGSHIVYPAYHQICGESKIIQGKINHHAGCALMMRRVLNEYRFKENLRHWDGLELFKRINSKGCISYYTNPVFYYRISKTSLSRTNLKARAQMLVSLGLEGIQAVK